MEKIISKKATIGKNVKIGYYSIIEDDAKIGDNTEIGNNVIIKSGSKIGSNCRISDFAVIGREPLKSSISAFTQEKEYNACEIKDNCLIGNYVNVYVNSVIGDNVLLADFVSVREESEVGAGSIVGRASVIENQVKVGKKCKIQAGVYLCAKSEVEDFCFIAPGVCFTNDNYMGRTEKRFKLFKGVVLKRGARIGGNATILPGKAIAEDAVVAAGSVVTRDIEAKKIVKGAPAKVFKDVPDEELIDNNINFLGKK